MAGQEKKVVKKWKMVVELFGELSAADKAKALQEILKNSFTANPKPHGIIPAGKRKKSK